MSLPHSLSCRAWTAFPVFLFMLTACGPVTGRHRFEIVVEDGAPTAVTYGGPRYQEPLFRIEEVTRVQQEERVPGSLLSSPGAFLPGPGKTLIVTEPFEGRVVVYDENGRFLRELGGKGSGPGQFQFINAVRVEGNTIVITDGQLQRITRLQEEGTVLTTTSTSLLGNARDVRTLADGRVAVTKGRFEYRDPYALQAVDLFLMEAMGGDTLAVISTRMITTGQVTRGPRGSFSVSSMPMTGQPQLFVLPDGRFLASEGDVPVIRFFGPDGHLSSRVRLDEPERTMTPELRAVFFKSLDAQAAFYGRIRDPSEDKDTLLPEKAGWWSSVTMDDAGYLWLYDVLSNPAWVPSRPWRQFILAPDGRWLGTMEVPTMIPVIRDGLLYALPVDEETGMKWPTVYRLIPNAPGFSYP